MRSADDEFLMGIRAAGEGVPVEGEFACDVVAEPLGAHGAGRHEMASPPLPEVLFLRGEFAHQTDQPRMSRAAASRCARAQLAPSAP